MASWTCSPFPVPTAVVTSDQMLSKHMLTARLEPCKGPCFLGACSELKAGRAVPLAPSLCDLEHSKPAPSSPLSVSTHTQVCKKPQQVGGMPHPAPPQMSQAQQDAWGGVHWGTEWSGSGMWGQGRDASQAEWLKDLQEDT